MIFPRQKIYKSNLSKVFFTNKKLENKEKIIKKLKNNLKIKSSHELLLMPKGRVSLYLILKYLIKKNKKKRVLMSPYSIFDIVNVVIAAGGYPEFIDFEKNSFNLDVKQLDKVIKKGDCCCILLTHYSVNSNLKEIKDKFKNQIIVQDCAISLTSLINSTSIACHSNYAFFSFNVFKFISAIFGGAIITNDKKLIKFYKKETRNWKEYKSSDLFKYYFKGLKFKFFTNKIIFNFFTFPIIKFGDLLRINFIQKNSKNDPNPIKISKFPNYNKRKLKSSQIKSIINQSEKIYAYAKKRNSNYDLYFKNINNKKIIKFSKTPNNYNSCINFPIIVENREAFSEFLYKNNVDHSKYFYRDCSSLPIFKNFKKNCKNAKKLSNQLLFLPTHHEISKNQIQNIINIINNY